MFARKSVATAAACLFLAYSGAAEASSMKTIYSFACDQDGAEPIGPLLLSGDAFYGVARLGGAGRRGLVFKLTKDGSKTTLHNFYGRPYSGYPSAGLLESGGKFYGPAFMGGLENRGTVFAMDPSGTSRRIHSFSDVQVVDGTYPQGRLIEMQGAFFGTTSLGGAHGNLGAVYKIAADGQEQVVHSFAGDSDGGTPEGALVAVGGELYGTTGREGAERFGTIYKMTPEGALTTLHSFTEDDGIYPRAGLTFTGKLFYGTTSTSGANGQGSLFALAPDGTFKVIHFFRANATDGWNPLSALVLAPNGSLFGTTNAGGAFGFGTIFRVSPTGVYQQLYSFGAKGDTGREPGELTFAGGRLYGTTRSGGASGCGSVFSFTP